MFVQYLGPNKGLQLFGYQVMLQWLPSCKGLAILTGIGRTTPASFCLRWWNESVKDNSKALPASKVDPVNSELHTERIDDTQPGSSESYQNTEQPAQMRLSTGRSVPLRCRRADYRTHPQRLSPKRGMRRCGPGDASDTARLWIPRWGEIWRWMCIQVRFQYEN